MNIEQLKVIRESLEYSKRAVEDCSYYTSYEHKLEKLKSINDTREAVSKAIKRKQK